MYDNAREDANIRARDINVRFQPSGAADCLIDFVQTVLGPDRRRDRLANKSAFGAAR